MMEIIPRSRFEAPSGSLNQKVVLAYGLVFCSIIELTPSERVLGRAKVKDFLPTSQILAGEPARYVASP